jgi:hypothetical protein
MAACDFIGISFPQCYVTCMFQFFKFYLSALPSPPLVSLSEHQPVCFFSGFPFLATVAMVEQWPQSPSHAVQVMGHAGCWCCCWLPHPWCHQLPEPVYRVVAVVDAVALKPGRCMEACIFPMSPPEAGLGEVCLLLALQDPDGSL